MADAVIVAIEADAIVKANKTNKAKAMTDVAANKVHEADKADAANLTRPTMLMPPRSTRPTRSMRPM